MLDKQRGDQIPKLVLIIKMLSPFRLGISSLNYKLKEKMGQIKS